MSFTIDDVIAAASPVEKVVSICVAGKLHAEHERLSEELENLPTTGRLGGSPKVKELRDAIGQLEAEMAKRTFEFRFRALSPKAWSDLVAEHPDKTKKLAFDPESLRPAAIAACCVEPAGMDDVVKVQALLDSLTTAQQSQLFDAAWDVNYTAPKGQSSSAAFSDLQAFVKNFASATSEGSPEASSSDE